MDRLSRWMKRLSKHVDLIVIFIVEWHRTQERERERESFALLEWLSKDRLGRLSLRSLMIEKLPPELRS